MSYRKLAVLIATMTFVAAACNPAAAPTTRPSATAAPTPAPTPAPTATAAPTPTAAPEGCTVGVSWNNYQEERWAKWDEPALKAAIEAGGGVYIPQDAASSEEKQASDIENLQTQGADVLVVLAQNTTAVLPSVDAAIDAGVPVIAYDRLIESERVLYTSFNNVEVGRMEARVIFALVPTGNYVIIKGNGADANSDFLRAGMEEIIGDAVAAGDIIIVGETYTDNWTPSLAQTHMENFLTAESNNVQAVLAENDGMAGGVVAALEAQGLAGQVPVSGQDGDLAALNRVALGTQSVSVWKDARQLGTATGEAAIALCSDPDPANVAGTATFQTPGGNDVAGILLDPLPITQENLNLVLDAGWITEAVLCQAVPAGSVDGCP